MLRVDADECADDGKFMAAGTLVTAASRIEARFPGTPQAERPLPCWKVLVGRGGDAWDPVCGLVRGHEGPCSANPRDWPEWSDSDWAEARFPSEGTT